MSDIIQPTRRHPGRTAVAPSDRLRCDVRTRTAALREAIFEGRPWENELVDLATMLAWQAIPGLDLPPEVRADLAAHADRLAMVQDPNEAELLADHIDRLLDRTGRVR